MATNWQQNYQIYRRYARNLALLYQKRQDVRSFVELLLSLSAITIFGLFAIRPTIVTVIDLNNQITEKENTLSVLDNKILALAEAQQVYDGNRTNLELVDSAIPDSPSPELYARQIEGLANRHSLYILDINTGNVQILGVAGEAGPMEATGTVDFFPATSKSFEFESTVLGSYQAIHAFLRDFESLRRPMFEDTVSIRISQGELSGELALSIAGRLAYLPNE